MKKRVAAILFCFLFLFCACIGRVGYIIFSGDYTVSSYYNSYALTISKKYATIYDKNFVKLNNDVVSYMAVIRPNEKCLSELSALFDSAEVQEIKKELEEGYPVIREIGEYAECEYIQIFEVTKQGESNDVIINKLESLYGESVGEKKINFSINAKGRLLEGDSGEVTDDNYDTAEGLQLTVDSEINAILAEACTGMETGAAVVLDVDSGGILAYYSAPQDYLCRALCSYAVGSVFKLVVAAAAIENSINLNYTCTGSITVGDTTFSCQNEKSHLNQNMKTALANSCNCYFVNLALFLGADVVHEAAERFGFGGSTTLDSGWEISNGNLPSLSVLSSKGQLALLGFGQGSLTATPLAFAAFVAAVANGGVYYEPQLILADVEADGSADRRKTNSYRIMSEDTAETLREYMRYVVTNGTGQSADYNGESAGKTSTAQSGIYTNGKERLNTWFAGFYPYDKAQYAIVVLTEDGTSGAADCCPIFRSVVEKLDNL
ncbi:MAG: hypothetical protein LUH82_01355 [Clostridiales bacterium]|nr:hypothetical protein [Clostridiales bacterium]